MTASGRGLNESVAAGRLGVPPLPILSSGPVSYPGSTPGFVMRYAAAFLFLFGVLLLPTRAEAQGVGPIEALGVGDIVRVVVWNQPTMSGEIEVGPSGNLVHPIYQNVRAAGVPFRTIETDIRSVLEQYEKNPVFVAQPLFRMMVAGEVRKPDLYLVRPGMSVLEAIALSGGITEAGRPQRVVLVRNGSETIIDAGEPAGAGATQVRSGDQVFVPRRGDTVQRYLAPLSSLAAAFAALITLTLSSR